ncbi:hypothetical protein [Desulfitobacterium sp. LBE]|uniref:hypothetical protein n=1 Tax=Desulfitobacterium sp. LBE TaxID=884086 RepID=UPI00155B03C9|nr:hypothetical protein [Desulfitobacterium sp. LBE]
MNADGGADNILCGPVSTGQGVSGWNSCICNMEKYTAPSLIPSKNPSGLFSKKGA